VHRHHATAHSEILELLLQDSRVHDQAVAIVASRAGRGLAEDPDVRQCVRASRAPLVEVEGLLPRSRARAFGGVIDDGGIRGAAAPGGDLPPRPLRRDRQSPRVTLDGVSGGRHASAARAAFPPNAHGASAAPHASEELEHALAEAPRD
jgi:hypothetical protein